MRGRLIGITGKLLSPRLAVASASLGACFGLLEGIIAWGRMIFGVQEAMGPEILWVAPAFYGFIGLLLGIAAMIGLYVLRKLPVIPEKWLSSLPIVFLGFLAAIGYFNAVTMLVTSALWALAILAIGFSVRTLQLLGRRKSGAIETLAGLIPWIAVIVIGLWVVVSLSEWGREQVMLTRLLPVQ